MTSLHPGLATCRCAAVICLTVLSEGCRSVLRAEPKPATPVSYAGKSGRAARRAPFNVD